MPQEDEREELFTKWRGAKDNEIWTICDNCARDLLTTLDETLEVSKSLKWFYNEIDRQVQIEKNLLVNMQKKTDPLKRGNLNEGFTLIMRWWAAELYNEFYSKFSENGLIKKER